MRSLALSLGRSFISCLSLCYWSLSPAARPSAPLHCPQPHPWMLVPLFNPCTSYTGLLLFNIYLLCSSIGLFVLPLELGRTSLDLGTCQDPLSRGCRRPCRRYLPCPIIGDILSRIVSSLLSFYLLVPFCFFCTCPRRCNASP